MLGRPWRLLQTPLYSIKSNRVRCGAINCDTDSERPKAEMITATLPATSLHARAAARSRPRKLLTALPAPRPWRAVPARPSFSHMRPQGLGQDAVGSWLDLASFVALSKSTKTPYDDLATKIGEQSGSPGISRQAPCAAAGGVTWHMRAPCCPPPSCCKQKRTTQAGTLPPPAGEDVFLDVSGWHLYLRDAKLAPGSDLTMAQGLAAQLALEVMGPQFSSDELHAVLKWVVPHCSPRSAGLCGLLCGKETCAVAGDCNAECACTSQACLMDTRARCSMHVPVMPLL